MATETTSGCGSAPAPTPGPDPVEPDPHPRHYTWQELMRRVFAVDVLECPRCKGRMRTLAQIHPPETTRAILECLGLPIRPPPIADATSSPDPDHQFDLFDGDFGTGDFDLPA